MTVKVAQKSKESYMGCMPHTANLQHPCRYCSGTHAPRQLMERGVPDVGRWVISKRYARAEESELCMTWK